METHLHNLEQSECPEKLVLFIDNRFSTFFFPVSGVLSGMMHFLARSDFFGAGRASTFSMAPFVQLIFSSSSFLLSGVGKLILI